MNKTHREAARMAERVGLEVLSLCESGSNHLKVRVRRTDGTEANFIFPLSTSDRRAEKNRESDLRRFATGKWSPIIERKAA